MVGMYLDYCSQDFTPVPSEAQPPRPQRHRAHAPLSKYGRWHKIWAAEEEGSLCRR